MSVCVCVYIFIYPICNILNLISFVYAMCHKVSKVELPYQQGTHIVLLYVLYLPTPQSQTYHLHCILSWGPNFLPIRWAVPLDYVGCYDVCTVV